MRDQSDRAPAVRLAHLDEFVVAKRKQVHAPSAALLQARRLACGQQRANPAFVPFSLARPPSALQPPSVSDASTISGPNIDTSKIFIFFPDTKTFGSIVNAAPRLK